MNAAEIHWYEKATRAGRERDAALNEAARLRRELDKTTGSLHEEQRRADRAEVSNVLFTKEVQELRELLRKAQVENAACAKAALKTAKRKILSIYIEDETT